MSKGKRHKWDRPRKHGTGHCTVCGCRRETQGLYPVYWLNGERFDKAPECAMPAAKKKSEKKECPYDDWACRVYGYCGTKKCSTRQQKIKDEDE